MYLETPPRLIETGVVSIMSVAFAPGGEWSLMIEYEGWPNGLKIAADGRILVADCKHGLTVLDAKADECSPC